MVNNHDNILLGSTAPLAFTTKGQSSVSSIVKSNESSIRVEYDNDEAKSYLTYACNFTQSSTGTHTLDWSFTPNHNTKGYIKNDGFKIFPAGWMKPEDGSTFGEFVEGIGTSAANPMPVEGGLVALDFTGLTYKESTDARTNRLVAANIYYKFPSNSLLDEEGTGEEEINLYSCIGQTYTNTPDPSISFVASTDATYLHTYHGGLHDKDYAGKTLAFHIQHYDDGSYGLNSNYLLYAYIDSNLGSAKKGTCSGLITASVSPNTATPAKDSTVIKCLPNTLSISNSDNSQAKTNPRSATLIYRVGAGNDYYNAFYNIPNNDAYRYESWNGKEFPMTVYQAGGNLSMPDPTVNVTFEYDDVKEKQNAQNWGSMIRISVGQPIGPNAPSTPSQLSQLQYNWNSNEGEPGQVNGDLTTTPSRLTQEDTEITEGENNVTIKCPDNKGTDIEIEIDGHSFTRPTNTKARSIKGKFLIECVNDEKGSAGSLSNELNDSSNNPKRKVPFTMTQAGKTNPEPSFTIKQSIRNHASNPDTSIYPSLTFDGLTVDGKAEQTWTINSEGKKTLTIHIPNTRPSTEGAEGPTVTERTSVLGGIMELQSIPASGGKYTIPITWNYEIDDFHQGYIPASGDYRWVTYFPDINVATGVTDELYDATETFDIIQPGNDDISVGAYPTVSITMTGIYGKDGQQPAGKCYATNITENTSNNKCTITRNGDFLEVSPSPGTFTFVANPNNASISSISGKYSDDNSLLGGNGTLEITHNGVNATERTGYINFTKSHGKLQYPGQTETISKDLGLFYRILGENYGGKIQISTTKVSGNGGSVEKIADIDLSEVPSSGKSYNLFDLVKRTNDNGYVDGSTFKVPSSVTIDATESYSYIVSCTQAEIVAGGISIWNVYGTIVGTVNSSLNNTPLHGVGFTDSDNGVICTVSTIAGVTLPNSSYYKFWWTPAIDGVTMTSSGSNATIKGFSSNVRGNNAIATKTEYMGDGYWIKVTGGQSASTERRKLGTLSAGWNTTTPTSSVDVWQNGSGGGAITNTNTFNIKFYNCTGHLSTDSNTGLSSSSVTLSSSGPNDPQSVNGTVDTTNWDCYSCIYNRASLSLADINNVGKDKSIGAFDNDIDEYIGIDESKLGMVLYYNKFVEINGLVYNLGLEDIEISESQLSKIELTWDDGVKTGSTRHIQISASNPGTYTYTCTAINIEYTFTNKYDGKSVTLNDAVHNGTGCAHTPITWTFTVDSKHYYNA